MQRTHWCCPHLPAGGAQAFLPGEASPKVCTDLPLKAPQHHVTACHHQLLANNTWVLMTYINADCRLCARRQKQDEDCSLDDHQALAYIHALVNAMYQLRLPSIPSARLRYNIRLH